MNAPRVSIAWILTLIFACIIAFFGYHILSAMNNTKSELTMQSISNMGVMPMDEMIQQKNQNVAIPAMVEQQVERVPIPEVPAQTKQDLEEDEPLRRTPPDVEYGEPHSLDPHGGPVHSVSEFGDNLRHPEQMIEVAPPLGTSRMVPSGLGSEKTAPGNNRPSEYSSEMAQNGGEFMSGIMAFDGTDGGGIGYSMI
jgi:hypothetical protein